MLGARRDRDLDEADIREFLATDYRRLVAGLTLVAGSPAQAEDAVQEALARAWERSDRGEHIESLKAWVTVVSTNILRSGFRRLFAEQRARRRAERAAASGLPPSEERIDVERAILRLPFRQRQVVALHYFADLSLAEIAKAIGSNEGAVKATLHRARHALAKALSENEPKRENDVVELG